MALVPASAKPTDEGIPIVIAVLWAERQFGVPWTTGVLFGALAQRTSWFVLWTMMLPKADNVLPEAATIPRQMPARPFGSSPVGGVTPNGCPGTCTTLLPLLPLVPRSRASVQLRSGIVAPACAEVVTRIPDSALA